MCLAALFITAIMQIAGAFSEITLRAREREHTQISGCASGGYLISATRDDGLREPVALPLLLPPPFLSVFTCNTK